MQLARLFSAGFDGSEAPGDLLSLIARGLGGVVLFRRNVESPEQVHRLVASLKRAAHPRPLIVSVDQEGGRVARLRGDPWAPIPPMRVFGSAADGVERATRLGALLARELRAVGIDLDFAPVLDVDTNPANPVIGDRSFSREPRRVADLGKAFIGALQNGGVAACGKHFPGHGDTEVDSHLLLPRVSHARERLERIEFVPFRAAIEAGVAAIMSAHVVCEAFDEALPATLSAPTLDHLRRQLNFDGVIVSDDLEMQALAGSWSMAEAAWRAIAAGCDHVLICSRTSQVPAAVERLERALASGEIAAERVREAIGRWDALARRFAAPAPGDEGLAWLRSKEHGELAAAVLPGDGSRATPPRRPA